MLTKKGKYGLKAAVQLARLGPGESNQVAEIAEANQIPKKFLDVIPGGAAQRRLPQLQEGHDGRLQARQAARRHHRVGDLIRALDGPLAPIPCASRNAFVPCDDCDVEHCEVRRLMVKVRDAMGTVLDTYTLAQMRDLRQDRLSAFVDYI